MGLSGAAFKFEERSRGYAEDTMSQRAYVVALSLLVTGGLALATLVASTTYQMTINWLWIVLYFAVAIPGVILSASSMNWFLSLMGYLMVILPTGAIVGPFTHYYAPASVLQVAFMTIGVSAGIGFAGAIYPKSVEHWGGFLLTALFILIFGDIARIVMISFGVTPVALKMWDWVGAALFSAFIFYDMNRAMRLNYTLDNAVDSAVALYLDIINLFIRLLEATGKKK